MKIKLQYVRYMPKELEPCVLYVSEEFDSAAHLCACGCGAKIRTPLGPTDWVLEEFGCGPSLYPSVGNWQQQCQSHYLIRDGEIIWAEAWTPEQIAEGRRREEKEAQAYYNAHNPFSGNRVRGLWVWVKRFFNGKEGSAKK